MGDSDSVTDTNRGDQQGREVEQKVRLMVPTDGAQAELRHSRSDGWPMTWMRVIIPCALPLFESFPLQISRAPIIVLDGEKSPRLLRGSPIGQDNPTHRTRQPDPSDKTTRPIGQGGTVDVLARRQDCSGDCEDRRFASRAVESRSSSTRPPIWTKIGDPSLIVGGSSSGKPRATVDGRVCKMAVGFWGGGMGREETSHAEQSGKSDDSELRLRAVIRRR